MADAVAGFFEAVFMTLSLLFAGLVYYSPGLRKALWDCLREALGDDEDEPETQEEETEERLVKEKRTKGKKKSEAMAEAGAVKDLWARDESFTGPSKDSWARDEIFRFLRRSLQQLPGSDLTWPAWQDCCASCLRTFQAYHLSAWAAGSMESAWNVALPGPPAKTLQVLKLPAAGWLNSWHG
eukprot:CAMPEP_0170574500 /NCGR_PEP_ID=MMETSP0224-20130122/3331_1 /TAXON_ID=285029 /ORGANISM="Togula jolla, Strain CCCM 725" /LENGTH=181 /DNA_ID=CAMNT_0010897157 /DNA_START=17 /DNA_END=563 /DNA_ORIENTATION=-